MIEKNVLYLRCNLKYAIMIRSIPNPPMGADDVQRFRTNLRKHLRREFTDEERSAMERHAARAKAIAQQIIANHGGINPILAD